MTEIKDIHIGNTVRIEGRIYKVKSIDKSPYITHNRVDLFILELEFIEDDFGEKLADLANG
jgi:hypothetical protein